MTLARVALALALVGLVALAALVARYESARAAWRAVSAVEDTGYDAAASDARYRDVEDALTFVARAARASAVLVVIAGVALGRSVERRARPATTGASRALGRAIDLATLILVLGASRIHVASPGVTEALAWALPALLAAALLALALAGGTLGERAAARLTRR